MGRTMDGYLNTRRNGRTVLAGVRLHARMSCAPDDSIRVGEQSVVHAADRLVLMQEPVEIAYGAASKSPCSWAYPDNIQTCSVMISRMCTFVTDANGQQQTTIRGRQMSCVRGDRTSSPVIFSGHRSEPGTEDTGKPSWASSA
jgi:hypothetical protein